VFRVSEGGVSPSVQGCLAHKNPQHPRILQQAFTQGPTVALGGRAVSYERGTPVLVCGLDSVQAAMTARWVSGSTQWTRKVAQIW